MKFLLLTSSLLLKFLFVSSKLSDKQYLSMPPLFHVDNYDKCLLHAEKFLYCMITFQLHPLNPENTSEIWKIIDEISSDPENYKHNILRHWKCIPDLYSKPNDSLYKNQKKLQQKLNTHYNKKYKILGIKGNLTINQCTTQQLPYPKDIYSKIFNTFIIIYSCILLLATGYEVNFSFDHKANSLIEKTSSALSLRRNWQRLMTVNLSTADMEALRPLQGFRLINILTVIIIHTIQINTRLPNGNPHYIEAAVKNEEAPIDGTHLMQVFFMISSFLLSYQFFLSKEKITFRYFLKKFVQRYVRLTPVLAFSIAYASTWMMRLSDGPFWYNIIDNVYRRCRKNWWTNLLYINNFIDDTNMCFGHTWYLAVNTQFYIFCFLIFYLIQKFPKRIIHIFGTLITIHIVYLFGVHYKNNYPAQFKSNPEFEYNEKYLRNETFRFLHSSLGVNSAGFITGLIFGYIFYKYRNKKVFSKKNYKIIWWILILVIPATISVTDAKLKNENRLISSLYGSLRRIIMVFSKGLLFFGMTQGEGWFIKWINAATPVYILGRLTYAAFIIHPIIQHIEFGRERTLNFIDNALLSHQVARDISLAFIWALVVTLFIEMPIIELQNMYTSKKQTTK